MTKTSAARVAPLTNAAPAYPALKFTSGGDAAESTCYVFSVPIGDLFEFCYVDAREDDPVRGFQRVLDARRAQEIADYLDGGGTITQSLTLSAQPRAAFEYNRGGKSVTFARKPKAFLVLDGQHRLWGFSKAKVARRVLVAVHSGLSRAAEARIFIDINTKQRGVPSPLLLDIKALAEVETGREAKLRAIYDALATDPKSPLRDRMSPARTVPGKITRAAFNAALGPALGAPGALKELDAEPAARTALLVHYFAAVAAELGPERAPLLTKAAFFGGLCDVFNDAAHAARVKGGDGDHDTPATFRAVLRPLAAADYSSEAFGGAQPNKRAVALLMRGLLRG